MISKGVDEEEEVHGDVKGNDDEEEEEQRSSCTPKSFSPLL